MFNPVSTTLQISSVNLAGKKIPPNMLSMQLTRPEGEEICVSCFRRMDIGSLSSEGSLSYLSYVFLVLRLFALSIEMSYQTSNG